MIFDMVLIWFMKIYDDQMTLLRWFTVAIFLQSFKIYLEDIRVNEISWPERFSTNTGCEHLAKIVGKLGRPLLQKDCRCGFLATWIWDNLQQLGGNVAFFGLRFVGLVGLVGLVASSKRFSCSNSVFICVFHMFLVFFHVTFHIVFSFLYLFHVVLLSLRTAEVQILGGVHQCFGDFKNGDVSDASDVGSGCFHHWGWKPLLPWSLGKFWCKWLIRGQSGKDESDERMELDGMICQIPRNGRWYSNLFKDPQQRQCPTFHIQLCMDIRCGISILQLSTFNDLLISVWGGPSSSSFQTFLATSVMHFSLGSFPFAANSGEKVWAAEKKEKVQKAKGRNVLINFDHFKHIRISSGSCLLSKLLAWRLRWFLARFGSVGPGSVHLQTSGLSFARGPNEGNQLD